jgi:DNA-binding IclR family transcriptional regulator
MDSSLERMLDVLRLFTEGASMMSIDEAVERTGYSRSTVYRYFRTLASSGLLWPVAGGAYALGPFVLELDRHIRLNDPLLRAAPAVMAGLHQDTGQVILLSRFYHNSVTCIHQEGQADGYDLTAGRGLRLHLFRGATSKIILAHLGSRELKEVYVRHAVEIAKAELGSDWQTFRQTMRAIRKQGYAISRRGEVDPEQFGVSAPVLDSAGHILAGLTIVVRDKLATPDDCERLVNHVLTAAEKISSEVTRLTDALRGQEETMRSPEPGLTT